MIQNHDNDPNKTPFLIEVIKANIEPISQAALIKFLLGWNSQENKFTKSPFTTPKKADQEGNTSMHWAAKRGLQNVLTILSNNVDYNVELWSKNKLGLQPYAHANDSYIRSYLLRAMQLRGMWEAAISKTPPTHLLLDLSNNEKESLKRFDGKWLVERIEKINDYIQNLKNKNSKKANAIYKNLGMITQGERKAIDEALEKSEAKDVNIRIQLQNAIDKDVFPTIWDLTVANKKTGEHNAFWKKNKQAILEHAIDHLNKTIQTGNSQKVNDILENSPYRFAELVTHVSMKEHPFNVVLNSNWAESEKISMLKVLIPYFSLDTILYKFKADEFDEELEKRLLDYVVSWDLDFVKWVVKNNFSKHVPTLILERISNE